MDRSAPRETTRRTVLVGLPVLAVGSLSGCSFGDSGRETPTQAVTTGESLTADFDDGTMDPLEPHREIGESPQVVAPLDGEGHVLELAAVRGRTCSVRSSLAVRGPLTASVRARRQRGSPDETTIALRLVDRRSGETAGAVVEDGTRNLVQTWTDDGGVSATGSTASLDSWTELSVTARSGEVAIDGGAVRSDGADGFGESPLAVELAVSAGESAESNPVVWFDDLDVSPA